MKIWLLVIAAAAGAQAPVVGGDAELAGTIGGKAT